MNEKCLKAIFAAMRAAADAGMSVLDGVEDTPTEKPVKPEKPETPEKPVKPDTDTVSTGGGEDLFSKSTKELCAMCAERGIKVPTAGRNKQFYIDKLTAAASRNTTVKTDSTEDSGEDSGADPYEGKTARELFDEAKRRGIKLPPRKDAAFYKAALVKNDKEQAAADSDEDWGDEEAAETPAEKTEKKPGKGKKQEEPAADSGDGDDDWDI